MKGFPGSDQNSDDTSPPKDDLCDFETSLRIHIRHDSDNEREKCTSNENPHFSHFFQFFKSLERTFSSSVDSQNSFKRKKVSNRKGKTYSSCIWHPTKGCFKNSKTKIKTKKQRRSGRASGRTCTSLSHNDGKRSHGVYSPNHLVNHKCISVCVILSLCLSYPVLRLLVSPRLQQELHNCGVTHSRGLHERCLVPLYTEHLSKLSDEAMEAIIIA